MGDETREARGAAEATQPQEPSQLSAEGIQSIQGSAEGTSDSEVMKPHEFGTLAHEAYQWAAEEHFEDAESKHTLIVTKPDGTTKNGEIDTLIDERVVIDYKTDYMPDWSVADARRLGDQYGRQVEEYVNGEGMPPDACGWIIATVPSESAEVRQAFVDAAGAHGVSVKFSKGEQQEDVIEAVSEAVAES
jgi:hypothetical protein